MLSGTLSISTVILIYREKKDNSFHPSAWHPHHLDIFLDGIYFAEQRFFGSPSTSPPPSCDGSPRACSPPSRVRLGRTLFHFTFLSEMTNVFSVVEQSLVGELPSLPFYPSVAAPCKLAHIPPACNPTKKTFSKYPPNTNLPK